MSVFFSTAFLVLVFLGAILAPMWILSEIEDSLDLDGYEIEDFDELNLFQSWESF